MENQVLQTGFGTTSSKFDTTGLDAPFYETSSERSSLIEQIKNNTIVIAEEVTHAPFEEEEN